MTEEDELLTKLRAGDIKAFKKFIQDYGEDLTIYAYVQLQDNRKANAIVDKVLMRLLQTRFVEADTPLHTYLNSMLLAECKSIFHEHR